MLNVENPTNFPFQNQLYHPGTSRNSLVFTQILKQRLIYYYLL